MMKCPFCDPEISDAIFARSKNFLAVYNIAPIAPGHSLIIPRNHHESILELKDAELEEMMIFSRRVTRLLMKVFDTDGFDWSVQDKEIAGQTLAHLHLHIVLRYPGDMPNPGDWYPKIQDNYNKILDSTARERLSKEELHKIIERLRKENPDNFKE
jgi:bis(5'-adenosyl)-triphosphatase